MTEGRWRLGDEISQRSGKDPDRKASANVAGDRGCLAIREEIRDPLSDVLAESMLVQVALGGSD